MVLRLLSLRVRCEFFDVRLPPDPNYSDIRTGEERKGGKVWSRWRMESKFCTEILQQAVRGKTEKNSWAPREERKGILIRPSFVKRTKFSMTMGWPSEMVEVYRRVNVGLIDANWRRVPGTVHARDLYKPWEMAPSDPKGGRCSDTDLEDNKLYG